MRDRRGKRSEKSKTIWVIAGIVAVIVIVSGGLIAYDMLSRGSPTYRGLENFEAFEVYFDTRSALLPNLSLITVGPRMARYEVYMFYDLYCPYCAWEIYESLPMLLEHIRSGKIKLYLVDTIIHPGAIESHGLLRSSVGIDGVLLEALYKASYELHVNGKLPEPSLMREILGNLGVKVDEMKVVDEVERAKGITIKAVELLESLPEGPRYVGTPTMVIYDTEFRKVVHVIPGVRGSEELNTIIKELP